MITRRQNRIAEAQRKPDGIKPAAGLFPASGIRAGVLFYAPAPGATVANPEFILSWQ